MRFPYADCWEMALGDKDYPSRLLDLEKPPEVLYGRGDVSVLATNCMGIIGARKASPYGIAASRSSARISVECGVTVVSGGAMGCDVEASRAALERGGKTIIVTGTGADKIYPPSSEDVFLQTIAGGGCVISQERWGTPPRRYTFPKRNLLIAALSHSLLVCEAGMPSGTMSTATCANDLGRKLYAIPGAIFSPLSRGTNSLIANGASIICDEASLELQIGLDFGQQRLIALGKTKDQGRILSALYASQLRPEELAWNMGEDVLTVVKTLTMYEAHGLVQKLPDGRYSLTADAYVGDVGST